MAHNPLKFNVIIADDFEQDLRLLELALNRINQFRIVLKAEDGSDVIDYLKGKSPFGDRELFPWPQLLILDLKMLKVDGFDVLRWIQGHPIAPIFTIVSTGYDIQRYSATARELGASAVFNKPITSAELKQIAICVENFVLSVVSDPSPVHLYS